MIEALLRIAGLTGIYLLVLTSLDPGDILVGTLLAAALVISARRGRSGHGRSGRGRSGPSRAWGRWLVAVVRMILATAAEIAIGTLRVIRFCLAGTGSPGFVEIPRGDRSRHGVALWGLLTGEAPDEYPVAVDDRRQILVVHTVDARDPDAIRARHAAARAGHQRDVAT